MTPDLPVIGTQKAIVIAGADARPFAQSQFCGDVDALSANGWQWNAWLTPAGKVRALMRLVDAGDGSLLMLPHGGDAPALVAQLQRYVMRAQVALSVEQFTARAGAPLPMEQVASTNDGFTLGLGQRSLNLVPIAGVAPIDGGARGAWRQTDIRAGWPILPDGDPEFLPPALGLEHLGAIAYDKGCYPGQEIAARLHFRGGHKRRLCHLRGAAPLPVGAMRTIEGAEVFVIDSVCEDGVGDALVVLRDEITHEINIMENIYNVVSSFVA